jgi:small subunit ribosomal protein S3
MAQHSTIRKFIDRNVERQLVREYLLSKTERAGFGGLDFQRTPEGTKVTLSAERVGMVIGRKGKIINELQRHLQNNFKLNNPRLEVAEIEHPAVNAQVMASKLASALERGWYFRRAGHSTLLNIMDAGAKGCLVVLSGKLTGSRNRTQKFQKGNIKYCGDTALQFMDIGKAVCVKKLGTIGCTVAIMHADSKLPHEIRIKERHEVGLSPLQEVAIIKEGSLDIVDEPITEEAPTDEILEEVIEEPETEGIVDTTVEAVKDTAGEVIEAVVETGSAAIDAVKDVAGEVVEAVSEVASEIAEGDVVGAAKEVVEGVVEITEAAVEGVVDVAEEIVEGVVEIASEAIESTKDIADAVADKIKGDSTKEEEASE